MKRRYLLDTGAVEEWSRADSETRKRAAVVGAAGSVIGTCIPVVGELWYGVENSATRETNAKRLRRTLTDLILWPYTEAAAEEFGRLRALLRRNGRPVQAIDIQIAAVALSLGNTVVVSMDTDLAAIPGLTVEDWSKPAATT
jgi:tRNA(fMet)-specific endonuclease VapC